MKNSLPDAAGSAPTDLARRIIVATGCRVLLNTGRRFAYPFAPAFSRGLGVSLTSITSVIAAMQLSGVLGVISGPLTDRWGYRKMMIAGLGLLAVGMLVVGAAPFYGALVISLVLAGVAKNIFDPAVYGYTSRNVPFCQRGRVIGILEFSWALSALVGIPLVGFMIDNTNWRAPFWFLGVSAVACIVLLVLFIPRDQSITGNDERATWRRAWSELFMERSAVGLMGFVFWASLGNDQVFVVYGAWMEHSFGIGIAAIGLSAGVIGVAELIGEGLTVTVGDRIGLKRAAMIGLALAALGYAILPFLSTRLPLALSGLFVIFLTFEFSMVCGISLTTEALPCYRATMMSGFFCAAGFGRVVGALIGGPVWSHGGILVVGGISAAASLLGLACLFWGVSAPAAGKNENSQPGADIAA